MTGVLGALPEAWADLEGALRARRPVLVYYHGRWRLICPHALGWKDRKPMLLGYQTGGETSTGALPADPRNAGAASSSTRSTRWWRPTRRPLGRPPTTTTPRTPSTPSTTSRSPSPATCRRAVRYYTPPAQIRFSTWENIARSRNSQEGPARWNRTTDLSIISAAKRAGQAIGLAFDLPVHATTSHQKTARATSFGTLWARPEVYGLV